MRCAGESLPARKGVAVKFYTAAIAMMLAVYPSGNARATNSAGTAAWRGFFQRVLPAARLDFAPLRGAFDRNSGDYTVKGSLNSAIVKHCIIFQTGALDSHAWNLRCDISGYEGQAAGPSTLPGTLTTNLSAALPGFKRTKNLMGEPEWIDAHRTSVTIVFGGILVKHGYSGI